MLDFNNHKKMYMNVNCNIALLLAPDTYTFINPKYSTYTY